MCSRNKTKDNGVSGKIVARVTPKDPNNVAIVTLGGAGHEPVLSGYVGQGMLDYSVIGDILTALGALNRLAGY
ncbi:dihydroxyacetone kinase subunit DhaK [Vibrio hippocampi]|nr:dihydroxyacetone kinase subunit DhaK [Vibrio hippocampi]